MVIKIAGFIPYANINTSNFGHNQNVLSVYLEDITNFESIGYDLIDIDTLIYHIDEVLDDDLNIPFEDHKVYYDYRDYIDNSLRENPKLLDDMAFVPVYEDSEYCKNVLTGFDFFAVLDMDKDKFLKDKTLDLMLKINNEPDISVREKFCDELKDILYKELYGRDRYTYMADDISDLYINFDSNSGLTVTQEVVSLEQIYDYVIDENPDLPLTEYIMENLGDIICNIGERDVLLHDVINEDFYITGGINKMPLKDRNDLWDIVEELYECKKADDNIKKFEEDLKNLINEKEKERDL